MHRTYPHSSYGPPPPPSSQNKVILQREYREKEGECFNKLRDVIKDLTGEELRTRQEILKKATGILLTASEIRKRSKEAQPDILTRMTLYETSSPIRPEGIVTAHTSDFFQPPDWSQSGQFDAELHLASLYYDPRFYDQQHYVMSGMGPAFNQASSPGYDEGWPIYSQP